MIFISAFQFVFILATRFRNMSLPVFILQLKEQLKELTIYEGKTLFLFETFIIVIVVMHLKQMLGPGFIRFIRDQKSIKREVIDVFGYCVVLSANR